MILYRLVHPRHSLTAFSGEGAFRVGGRWNLPGVRVVYTSSSVALAMLELLAYRKAMKPLTPRHLYRVTIDNEQIRWLEPGDLPKNWNEYPYPESTQGKGTAWAKTEESLALAVPSVLVPLEYNVVLNCSHADFRKLEPTGPEDFPVNPRLMPDLI